MSNWKFVDYGTFITNSATNYGWQYPDGSAVTANAIKPEPQPSAEELKHLAVMRDFDPDWDAYWAAVEYFQQHLPPSPWIVIQRPTLGRSAHDLFPLGAWRCKSCLRYDLALTAKDGVAVYRCPRTQCRDRTNEHQACQATYLPLRTKSGPSLDSQRNQARKALSQIWELEYLSRQGAYDWLAIQLAGSVHVSCWHMNPTDCARTCKLVEWYLTGGEGEKP